MNQERESTLKIYVILQELLFSIHQSQNRQHEHQQLVSVPLLLLLLLWQLNVTHLWRCSDNASRHHKAVNVVDRWAADRITEHVFAHQSHSDERLTPVSWPRVSSVISWSSLHFIYSWAPRGQWPGGSSRLSYILSSFSSQKSSLSSLSLSLLTRCHTLSLSLSSLVFLSLLLPFCPPPSPSVWRFVIPEGDLDLVVRRHLLENVKQTTEL